MLAWFLAVSLAVCCGTIDVRTGNIPDKVVVSSALMGLVYHAIMGGLPGLRFTVDAAVIFLLFGLLAVPGWMGMGDVKLMAAIAAWVGFWPAVAAFAIGCLPAGIVGLATIPATRGKTVRFGLYLAVGVAVVCAYHFTSANFHEIISITTTQNGVVVWERLK